MKKYELFTIFPGTRTEEEVNIMKERVKSILNSAGADKIEEQEIGKMKIAYPIKHIRYGYFYNFNFDAEPEIAQKIQNKLVLEQELLRALVRVFNPMAKTRPRPAHAKLIEKEIPKEPVVAVHAAKPVEQAMPVEKAKVLSNLDEEIEKILEEEFIKDI